MQEDIPAWPQPMWGLFRLGRTGPVRSDHGRKGGTAWIFAPGKTGATNRNHAARRYPIETMQPGRCPIARVHPRATRNVSGIPPAAPQRSATINDPGTAIQSKVSILPNYPLPRVDCWYPRPGTPPSILPGGAEDRVSEGAVREAAHIFGVGR